MASSTPTMEIRREVRFATVMYGGVSLAIYINGVTQELLRMVRATAASPQNDAIPLIASENLCGTERVYRQLGQLLGREGDELEQPWQPDDPIHTRFIIDILSGTSAGGINAIFLAKALANDQNIDQLKTLWIEEGDVAKLFNDAESIEGLDGLKVQNPPKSLLNSQRMYRELLNAFDGMDREKHSTETTQSPYVEELDLFVTTTDISGLPIWLRLADGVVPESRHKNVFQFRYRNERLEKACNDFHAANNPFLAFTARCTSAFPFAFEPMKLSDIDAVLKTAPSPWYKADVGLNSEHWKRFFPDYQPPSSGPALDPHLYEFTHRAFGDGGYLDNKPFGYATDTLSSRRATFPVDRKLIYIEPSPEHPERQGQNEAGPNVIENVLAALSLARYETIREDLQRILSRNRLIDRVERIISGMEEDVQKGPHDAPTTDEDFGKSDLTQMIEHHGVAYGAYHRLKVAVVTDDITALITNITGFDSQSDEFFAIRYLVRAWRETNYTPYHEAGRATQNEFLLQYDMAYRLRRLNFVLDRIAQLYCLNEKTKEMLKQQKIKILPAEDMQKAEFREELARLRNELEQVYHTLRQTRDDLALPSLHNPLVDTVAATKLTQGQLHEILNQPTESHRLSYADELVSAPVQAAAFKTLGADLALQIEKSTRAAAERCAKIFTPQSGNQSRPLANLATDLARHYYETYERYDLISYPILYSTEVGEEIDTVEVIRISPEDAPSLIDERQPGRRKLAGTSLGHFGAFLDRGWRQNDILWGRLDGAERIITTLLRGTTYQSKQDELIRQAHLAILSEEFGAQDQNRLCQLLADAMAKVDVSDPSEDTLRQLVMKSAGAPMNPLFQSVLRQSLNRETLLEFFQQSYEVNREMNPTATVRALSRATEVVGKMLEDLANTYRVNGHPAAWVTRLGRIFWGFVEVAIPHSLGNLVFRYWLQLLYLFETLLIIGGTVFASHEVQRFGLITFGVTAAINLGWLLLGDYMSRQTRRLPARVILWFLVITCLTAVGIYSGY